MRQIHRCEDNEDNFADYIIYTWHRACSTAVIDDPTPTCYIMRSFNLRKTKGRIALVVVSGFIAFTKPLSAQLAPDASTTVPTDGSKGGASSSDSVVKMDKYVSVDYANEAVGNGTGHTQATVDLPHVDIAVMPAGQNPILLLGKTPGVNVQSSDSIGLYEHANRVQIRAFNINQIAVTLDGVPLGQQNYYGGTPVDRLLDSESLGSVTVSTGVAPLEMFANTALGGAMQYLTIAPREAPTWTLSQSFGDFGYERTFVRYDTGDLGRYVKSLGGFTVFVSYSDLKAVKWRGIGDIFRKHFSAQVKYAWADNYIRFKYDYNDRGDHDYRSMSLGQYELYGRSFEYPTTATGKVGIKGPPTIAFPNGVVPQDAAYWDNQYNYRRDAIPSMEAHIKLAPDITLSVIPYYDKKFISGGGNEDGTGLVTTNTNTYFPLETGTAPTSAYVGNPKPVNTSFREFNSHDYYFAPIGSVTAAGDLPSIGEGVLFSQRIGHQERFGVPTTITYDAGPNVFSAGAWLQKDSYYRYDVRFTRAGGVPGGTNDLDQLVYGNSDATYHTFTGEFFVADHLALLDKRLKFTFGARALQVHDYFKGYPTAFDFALDIKKTYQGVFKNNFLPSVGGTYDITKENQVFAGYSESIADPVHDVFLSDGYHRNDTPESSKMWEGGLRSNYKKLTTTLAAYYVKYGHRLFSFNNFDPSSSRTVSTYTDVGGVTSKGVEAAIAVYPLEGLRVSTSLTYNDTTFDNDFTITQPPPAPSVPVHVTGQTVPDFPKWNDSIEIDYNLKSFYIGWNTKYMSSRVSSVQPVYTGASVPLSGPGVERISGYFVTDLFVGYQSYKAGHLRLQVNIANLFDKSYLASISPGLTAGTFQPGAPRTVYFTASTEF